jgi:hypothetical protein
MGMKLTFALIVAVYLAVPVLAQAPATATTPKPAAPQHQPGTAAPAHTPGTTAAKAPSTDTPGTAKVDPEKEAAIRHLMEITQTSKLGENIATYIAGQVRSGVSHGLTPDTVPKFMDTFNEKFAATGASTAVMNAMIPI